MKLKYSKASKENVNSRDSLKFRKELIQKQYAAIGTLEEYAMKIDEEFVTSLKVQQNIKKRLLKKESELKLVFEENSQIIQELQKEEKLIIDNIKNLEIKINRQNTFKDIDKKQQILITKLKKELEEMGENE